jgi:hypothetical protein
MSNKNVVAPRLPSPPAEYDQQFFQQFNNILRLYFNGLDGSGPINVSTQRRSATDIIAAISCVQPNTTGSSRVISLPTQADLANLGPGDIYYDTSGGVAASYPLRIKA